MLRFAVLTILLAVVCAVPINDEVKSADPDVIVVDSIEKYLAQNPEVGSFEELDRSEIQGENRQKIRYTFGARVHGDRIVATKSYNLQWSNPQTVKVKLDYPVNGATGAVVSFVEILVEQSTNLGRAFINFGGIGQRQICIIVESRETLYWKFNSQIYGKN